MVLDFFGIDILEQIDNLYTIIYQSFIVCGKHGFSCQGVCVHFYSYGKTNVSYLQRPYNRWCARRYVHADHGIGKNELVFCRNV